MVTEAKPRKIKDIEELVRDSEDAILPEPGDMARTLVEPGMPMMVGNITSAGHAYIWDTRTGQRSGPLNRNMLKNYLTRKREDGSRVFTTADPGIPQFNGGVLCTLHLDHPRRPEIENLGLPVCRKSNLRTQYDADRHLQIKHTSAWKAIEARRKTEIEDEERQFRRMTIKQMTANTTGPVSNATVTVPQPTTTTVSVAKVEQPPISKACPTCGEVMTAKNMGGWNMKKFHHDKKHPKVA